MRSFVIILTRWSAAPNDGALAHRLGRGRSRGAAPHSGDCAREGIHSISARWSMPWKDATRRVSTLFSRRFSTCSYRARNFPYFIFLNETNRITPPLRARDRFRKRLSSTCERGPTGSECRRINYRGPFRTSYQLNPAWTNAIRAGRKKLGDESSWSRSLIRHTSKPAIIFYNIAVSRGNRYRARRLFHIRYRSFPNVITRKLFQNDRGLRKIMKKKDGKRKSDVPAEDVA